MACSCRQNHAPKKTLLFDEGFEFKSSNDVENPGNLAWKGTFCDQNFATVMCLIIWSTFLNHDKIRLEVEGDDSSDPTQTFNPWVAQWRDQHTQNAIKRCKPRALILLHLRYRCADRAVSPGYMRPQVSNWSLSIHTQWSQAAELIHFMR